MPATLLASLIAASCGGGSNVVRATKQKRASSATDEFIGIPAGQNPSCGGSSQCACVYTDGVSLFCGVCASDSLPCKYCDPGLYCPKDPCDQHCYEAPTGQTDVYCPSEAPVDCGNGNCCPEDHPICCDGKALCGTSQFVCQFADDDGTSGAGASGGGSGSYDLSATCRTLLDSSYVGGGNCSADANAFALPDTSYLLDDPNNDVCGVSSGYVAYAIDECFSAECNGQLGNLEFAKMHDDAALGYLEATQELCGGVSLAHVPCRFTNVWPCQ